MSCWPIPSERYDSFVVNPEHPWFAGADVLGLGPCRGSIYPDYRYGESRQGSLAGYTSAGNSPGDARLWDGVLRRFVLRHNDAGTNYVALPGPAGNFANNFTAAMWVWANESSGYAGFWKRTLSVSHQGAGQAQHALVRASASQLAYYYNGSNAVTFSYATPLRQWHHYALTHSSTNVVSLYVDGVLLSSGDAASLTLQPTYSLYLGDRNYGVQCLRGCECDFTLHSPALSADEIKGLADPNFSIDLRPSADGPPLILPVIQWLPVAAVESGGVSGSGACVASNATASGSGAVSVAGTGAASGTPGAAAATGAVRVAGSAAISGLSGSVSAAGKTIVAGAGQAVGSNATASGTATARVLGTGTCAGSPAAASSTGTTTNVIHGDGTCSGLPGAVAGACSVQVGGAGQAVAQSAMAAALGAVRIAAAGSAAGSQASVVGRGRTRAAAAGNVFQPPVFHSKVFGSSA